MIHRLMHLLGRDRIRDLALVVAETVLLILVCGCAFAALTAFFTNGGAA